MEDGKGKGGKSRVLYTEYSPAFDAKNRLGLPPVLDMGSNGTEAWANLVGAIKEARSNG